MQDGEDIKLLGHSQRLFSFIFPNYVYPAADEKRTNELINFNCNVWVVLGVILSRYQTDMLHFLERERYVENNIFLPSIFISIRYCTHATSVGFLSAGNELKFIQ